MDLRKREFERELLFIASRSSGPGGQNVNKVSSKIELRFNVKESVELTSEEKEIIASKLGKRISNEGYLVIQSQGSRSQLKNKQDSIEKFYLLITKALTPIKKRKKTRPSLSSKAKRLESKRKLSFRKQDRKKIESDE